MAKKESKKLTEALLKAWMEMSIGIKGNRILKELSFNEMVICRILYQAEQEGQRITATDLCRRTRLLKSQVNKVLDDLEKRGLIYRDRDQEDRRRVFLRIREENQRVYLEEHARVLSIVEQVCGRLGKDESKSLVKKMNKVVAIMDELSDAQGKA